MKADTAVGEKLERANTTPYLNLRDLCMLLAKETDKTDTGFWPRVNSILRREPGLAGLFQNPSLRNFYERTANTWHHLAREEAAIVLQQPRCESWLEYLICTCDNMCHKSKEPIQYCTEW